MVVVNLNRINTLRDERIGQHSSLCVCVFLSVCLSVCLSMSVSLCVCVWPFSTVCIPVCDCVCADISLSFSSKLIKELL